MVTFAKIIENFIGDLNTLSLTDHVRLASLLSRHNSLEHVLINWSQDPRKLSVPTQCVSSEALNTNLVVGGDWDIHANCICEVAKYFIILDIYVCRVCRLTLISGVMLNQHC